MIYKFYSYEQWDPTGTSASYYGRRRRCHLPGGRVGNQADAWLWQLAGMAVDRGHVRPPDSWHTPDASALIAQTVTVLVVRRWEQRISAWLHTRLSSLLLRCTKPDGVSWIDALDTA